MFCPPYAARKKNRRTIVIKYIYIYIAQKFALVSVGFPFSCGNGQEDLQESLNGHIVSFSLNDRAIGGYRQ